MKNNRSVPTSTILPHVAYRDLPEACDWLTRVFGFVEHYRYGEPVSGIQVCLGDAYIMLTGTRPGAMSPAFLGFGTQMLTIMIADVENHHHRSKDANARIWEELNETVYGERQYGVEDLDGHRWVFSQHSRDIDPKDWGATISSPPKGSDHFPIP
jgi:uncharacterized glyoxalase superfamily protein PhnB